MAEPGDNIELGGGEPPEEETGTDETVFEDLMMKELDDLEKFPPVPQDLTEEGLKNLDSHARKRGEAFREMQTAKNPADATPAKARPVIDSRPGPATPVGESRLDASDKRRFRLAMTEDKKKFFLEKLKKRVKKTGGTNSKILFEKSELTAKSDDSGYTGLNFKGVEVATINDAGDLVFNNTSEAACFKDIFKKAATEYDGSLDAQAFEMLERLNRDDTPEKQPPGTASVDEGLRSADIPQEVIDSVMDEVIEDIKKEDLKMLIRR